MFKRLLSIKQTPSKTHFHGLLSDSSFPLGYSLTGIHCGIKKDPQVLDLALILSTSPRPTSAAACLTRNAFKAAPVLVSQQVLEQNNGRARAIVVNSGSANAVTGKQGLADAWAMARETHALLPVIQTNTPPPKDETLVMSTGVIGQPLPISKIISAIRSQSLSTLGSGFGAWERAAKAFMTTDTFPKLRSHVFTIAGKEYRMAGMDKGAGMIHPDMGPPSSLPHATLLGCILTDAAVSPRSLQSALTYAVERSFNSISVDGEMSTNDTILALANGAAASSASEIDEEHDQAAYEIFKNELTSFAVDLAKLVVRDGEGATKFVTVSVESAPTYAEAHKVASRISVSALLKTALYGEDANWGRVLSAMGAVKFSTPIDLDRVSVSFVPDDGSAPLPVLVNGEPENVDEIRAKEILSKDEFEIKVQMGLGTESAKYATIFRNTSG